jgi:hypothetical protein
LTSVILTAAASSIRKDGGSILLQEFEGIGFIQKVLDSYAFSQNDISIVLGNSQKMNNVLNDFIVSTFPKVTVHLISGETKGSMCSAMLGINDLDDDLLIGSADAFIEGDLSLHVEKLKQSKSDAGLIVFKGEGEKWSFTRSVGTKVIEIAEKQRISDFTTTGVFWFASGKIFLEAAESSLINKFEHENLYYSSSAIQAILARNGSVTQTQLEPQEKYIYIDNVKKIRVV